MTSQSTPGSQRPPSRQSPRRLLRLAGTVLCAVLIAPMVGTPAAAAEQDRLGAVTVSGQGQIQAEPDRALVTLGVEARRLDMEDARSQVAKTVDAVLELTRDLKIDRKHVRTTRVNIQPEYNWDNSSRQRNLIGYYVSRQVEVDLRDLDKLGRLLERAFDLGVNQAGDPQLESSKRRDLEREALARAMDDARLNAETIAKSAGARLGAVRNVTATSGYVPPPRPMQQRMMAVSAEAGDAAQTYQTGQMTFTGSVQVEYEMIVTSGQ